MVLMKSIFLNQNSLLYIPGNVLPGAITFSGSKDVLVGMSNGQLVLYRHKEALDLICEYSASDLITAVAAVDASAENVGFNFVCITALGLLTFLTKTTVNGKEAMQEVCTLQTPPNPSSLMFGKVEEDQLEIVIGYTDRFARIYQTKRVPVGQNSSAAISLELCCSISFTGHIGSMCSFFSYHYNSNCLLVSQPGATFVAISFSELLKTGGLFEVDDKIRRGPGSQSLLCRSTVKTSWCRPFVHFSSDDGPNELVCVVTLDGFLAICQLHDGVSVFEIALASQLVDIAPVIVSIENSFKCFIAVASWNGVIYLLNENCEIYKFETGLAPQCVGKANQPTALNNFVVVSLSPSSLISYDITENCVFFNPKLFGEFKTDEDFSRLMSAESQSGRHAVDLIRKTLYQALDDLKP